MLWTELLRRKIMTIFEWLESKNIHVNNHDLINQAFIHSSYVNEHKKKFEDNERLEFMGDAVLQLWSSKQIYNLQPAMHEGQMTTTRAQLVCEEALAGYVTELKLNEFLKLGVGEEKTGGRNRKSIMADSFEALLGALYLDGGLEPVDIILNEVILPKIKHPATEATTDYKSKLQEYVQSDHRKTVHYELIGSKGPSNCPEFEVVVKLDDIILGKGSGTSKKRAEQNAAKNAFEKLVV